jgi:putative DNA primase/helicase
MLLKKSGQSRNLAIASLLRYTPMFARYAKLCQKSGAALVSNGTSMMFFNQKRGQCPVCAYPDSYTETIGRNGQRIGWCASCQDRDAIAMILRGSMGRDQHPVAIVGLEDNSAFQTKQESTEKALAIWRGATPIAPHEPAGEYLTRRGLAHLHNSVALRYRNDVPHPAGGRYLALVALVQNANGTPLGVHRTYLRTAGHKAHVTPEKASKGPIWGGAIRLQCGAPEITVGEGIETAASAGFLLKLPAWAAVSAGNLATGMILPPEVKFIVIAADHDAPGINAAEAAARRWVGEGRKVRIVKPKQPGHDFNDILHVHLAKGAL